MNHIKIEYKIIAHPYPSEKGRTVYGEIVTKLVNTDGKVLMVLTHQVLDLLQYFNWFLENSNDLLNQNIPDFFPTGKSIAERSRKFKRLVYDDDKWNIIVENKQDIKHYEYTYSHTYFNSLVGSGESAIKFSREVYMGLNNNRYEISMYAEEDKKRKIMEEHWCYEFDMSELLQYARNEYNKIKLNEKT